MRASTATPAAAPAATPAAAALTPVPAAFACRADGSDQERVASAFVSAAIRLGPALPTEHAARSPYIGRHRRTVTVRPDADCQAGRS